MMMQTKQLNYHIPLDRPLIAPSILAANIGCLADDIKSLVAAKADFIHIDVMDGSFVPPITFGDNVVRAAKSITTLPLDVHLMINNPEQHIRSFAAAGASIITVHREVCPHLHRTLQSMREAGVCAGVSVNPGTPVESVFDVLDLCDMVLVMTVNPGYGAQEFIPSCLSKIRKLKDEITRRNLSVAIEVDGGINPSTAKQCREAGTNVFVAGSYVFKQADRRVAIDSLR